MAKSGIRMEGMRELQDALIKLQTYQARRVGGRAAETALAPVLAAAKAAAPVSDGEGAHYRDSLMITARLNKDQAREARRAGENSPDILVRYVGSSSPLAHLVEFGTGPRRQKGGRYVGAMPALPHLRPAWEANRDEVLRVLAVEMRVELEKLLARAAKAKAKAAAKAGK